jgi:poly-D-alanine transfer protein DltD
MYIFCINPQFFKGRGLSNPEFGRKVSKVWQKIIPTKNQTWILPNDS